jgi:methionyl aminopeptidase
MYGGFPRRTETKRIVIKTPREIVLMRHAGEISALALRCAGELVRPGITTWEINREIGNFIKSKGAKPSFRGLYGFPGNACISVNQELIHGVPSKKRYLREGDIVSIDVGAHKDGYHGDNAATFACGAVSEVARKLIAVGKQALENAIAQCYSGNRVGDISHAIQSHVEGNGFYIPEDFFGHGVGKELHEDPNVPNHGKPGRGTRLVPGMTIAIEPMVHSTTKKYRILRDDWTVVEGNGNLTAHFEHTVLITSGEPVILTKL